MLMPLFRPYRAEALPQRGSGEGANGMRSLAWAAALYGLLSLVCCLLSSPVLTSCSNQAPPEGAALRLRDSLPVMTTRGCSKVISDSGYMRYKIIAEDWRVFDRTNPPRQEFKKGILLQRFDRRHNTDLFITADTAYWYNQTLWELHGHVRVENIAQQTVFVTPMLFWDMDRHEFYSSAPMRVTTPTQQLEGDNFRSNENMTQYRVEHSRGYTPVPKRTETTAPDTASQRKDSGATPPQKQQSGT